MSPAKYERKERLFLFVFLCGHERSLLVRYKRFLETTFILLVRKERFGFSCQVSFLKNIILVSLKTLKLIRQEHFPVLKSKSILY